ncbi:hypothetical protein Afil01_08690 [Actinorhabdospora filicis]|uniref:Uncharacterized protein n=1 Tax=Actinorhabdospora filicis TaxID=1785913 RepID=A0A9W6SHI1_9ACTN|nr:hypothetical protein [Actinorhabdospora filicis]GLZ76062.1 hypothetical protein Afil01_08690 [Actinorhabdospora filicis]
MDTGQQHYPLSRSGRLLAALPRPERLHRPLLALAVLMGVTGLGSVIGLIVDDRMITGLPIWAKPLKFAISIAAYALSMAYLLPLVPKMKRTVWWSGTIIALMLGYEMVPIAGQAMRGTTSHFNETTPFDAAVWETMTIAIIVMWVANLAAVIVLTFARIGDRALTRALRWGGAIALIGVGLGAMMPPQRSGVDGIAGAHTVGGGDGGPGLPVLGWSTTGGDLRIAHFVGMHALQAIPLLALFLAGRIADETRRARIVLVAAFAYAGLTALVLWQALRGESLVHPSAPTLLALAALAVVTVAGVLLSGLGARRREAAAEVREPQNQAA